MKLLIGYGSTLRQDDGLGWWVASQLAPCYQGSDVRVICAHQLLPEVTASIAKAECVIFVDASVEGCAGSVQVREIQPSRSFGEVHTVQPPEILRLTDYLYGRCPKAYLVTITGEAFGIGDTLSERAQAAIPQAIIEIKRLLSRML